MELAKNLAAAATEVTVVSAALLVDYFLQPGASLRLQLVGHLLSKVEAADAQVTPETRER